MGNIICTFSLANIEKNIKAVDDRLSEQEEKVLQEVMEK